MDSPGCRVWLAISSDVGETDHQKISRVRILLDPGVIEDSSERWAGENTLTHKHLMIPNQG